MILIVPFMPIIGVITWLVINLVNAKWGGGGLFRKVNGAGWSTDHYGMDAHRWVGSKESKNKKE